MLLTFVPEGQYKDIPSGIYFVDSNNRVINGKLHGEKEINDFFERHRRGCFKLCNSDMERLNEYMSEESVIVSIIGNDFEGCTNYSPDDINLLEDMVERINNLPCFTTRLSW